MSAWGISNTEDGEVRDAGNTVALLDAQEKISNSEEAVYWLAPPTYLGNKVIVMHLLCVVLCLVPYVRTCLQRCYHSIELKIAALTFGCATSLFNVTRGAVTPVIDWI